MLRVLMQADAPFRIESRCAAPFLCAVDRRERRLERRHNHDASALRTTAGPTSDDGSAVDRAQSDWIVASPSQSRYNGYAAVEITGSNAPGKSSGEAMKEMERIVAEDLPRGFGYDWAGQSLQEILSGAEAPLLFALSILVVYLCLAALYESWAMPLAVHAGRAAGRPRLAAGGLLAVLAQRCVTSRSASSRSSVWRRRTRS